uniref:Uncharacterized protein n=1 Tax=viral metagenome TaxID=1070528 RepID=A0A6M3LF32_9ZZZZ
MISKEIIIKIKPDYLNDTIFGGTRAPFIVNIEMVSDVGHLSLTRKQVKELIADLQQVISGEEP